METKIDSDYKKAFNLGYEMAKELDLKTPCSKVKMQRKIQQMQCRQEYFSI